MFKNYFKVACRNLYRNKLYTIIGTVGLSLGIACCILIFLYTQHELSYDRFHKNANEIYRMIQFEQGLGELSGGTPSTSFLLGPQLKQTFPEITSVTSLCGLQAVVKYGDKSFNQSVVAVDPDFFSMFSFPLIQGDIATVLGDPGGVVLSARAAAKYFGDSDPMGEHLILLLGETPLDFFVSGVITDAPRSSSIQYDMFISTKHMKYVVPEEYLQTWDIILYSTYVRVNVGTDIAALEDRIGTHISGIYSNGEEDDVFTYALQPLTDIHLNPQYSGEMIASSDPVYSYILSGIALAVLFIACINFMTLAVGRSSSRAREVGMRKVLGAQRRQLMLQFWGESLIMSVAALALGIFLAELFLPAFNYISQRELSLDLFSNSILIPALGLLILITALLSGIYPAMLLSKLVPMSSLRGDFKLGGRNRLIQAMIALQFAISIFLIICTLIISSQIKYINNAKLGYDSEMVVTIPTNTEGEEAANLLDRYRNELAGGSEIVDIAGYSYPFGQSWLYISFNAQGQTVLIGEDITGPGYADNATDAEIYFYTNWIDPHYIPTMGIKVIEGRNFSDEHPSDLQNAIIVNQTAVKKFGWDNPIGQKLTYGFKNASVIGVVEDFHYYPLHREIEPLVLHMGGTNQMNSIFEISVRIRGGGISGTMALLEDAWNRISGGIPFEYSFLDDSVADVYAGEQRWRQIVQYASGLSILITCLGLFGLTSLAVAKRTREVGIRKVLGASVTRVVMLFSTNFMLLVLIANLIAWPAAYFVMKSWLQNFAYRTGIGLPLFLFTGLLVLAITFLTVSLQAVKAAWTNPANVLRNE
jgi:putative ABC transport system permease protein